MLEILKPSTCITVARVGRDFGGEQGREGTQQFKTLAEEDAGPVDTEKDSQHVCLFCTWLGGGSCWAGSTSLSLDIICTFAMELLIVADPCIASVQVEEAKE